MPESGEQRVLVGATRETRRRVAAPEPATAWRWVGWLGLVLLLAGFGDLALLWYPVGLGRPEWEFATIAQTIASLPLLTMGFAAALGAAVARGSRWRILGTAGLMLVFVLALLVMLALFFTNVPMALRATEGPALTGIKKAVAKTTWLGLVFLAGYGWAAIAALRHAKTATNEGAPS